MRVGFLVWVLTLPMLAACGGSDDPWPNCSDIWHKGNRVPFTYVGCREERGSPVEAHRYDCADGTRVLLYGDDWYTRDGVVYEDGDLTPTLNACDGVRHQWDNN